jgi:hypothetical protein
MEEMRRGLAGLWILAVLLSVVAFGQSDAGKPSTSGTLRWTEGAANSKSMEQSGSKVESLTTDNLSVIASFNDFGPYYSRAWVQVTNHGKEPVAFNPHAATLEITKPKNKTLSAVPPDRAADDIKKRSEADAGNLSNAGCAMMKAGCTPTNSNMGESKTQLALGNQQATWVHDHGLAAATLKPGEQAQGAIMFRREKKEKECILRIPVNDQVFEFPFTEKDKGKV